MLLMAMLDSQIFKAIFRKNLFSRNVSELFQYIAVYRKYIGNIIFLIPVLLFVTAIVEGGSVVILFPLLEFFMGGSSSSVSSAEGGAKYFIKLIDFLGFKLSIGYLLFCVAVIIFVKGAIHFLALATTTNLRGKLLGELKIRLINAYSEMSYDRFLAKSTGHYINVVNEQVARALQSFYATCLLITAFINAIVFVSLALFYAVEFGLFAIIFGFFITILFSKLNRLVKYFSRKTAVESGELSNKAIQLLQGRKYLLATSQTAKVKCKVSNLVDSVMGYQLKTGVASSFTSAIREPLAAFVVLFVIYIQVVIYNASLTPILVAMALFYKSLNSLMGVQTNLQLMHETIGSMELVDKEYDYAKLHKVGSSNGFLRLENFSNIQLSQVSFEYYGSAKSSLSDISILIENKKTVAIVGASGAGKTTLVDLLLGLYVPQVGQIWVDDKRLVDIDLEKWRESIGYVSQESVIFDDTIENNISMWDDSPNYKKNIKIAAQKAHLDEFIEGLPEKYQTQVGDRGARLSGGQKQRLCIARELYRNPLILVFDEATSSLDSESENEIRKSIDGLRGNICIILIAHRLSTIVNADLIILLESGKVVEQGSYLELTSSGDSRFSEFVNLQKI